MHAEILVPDLALVAERVVEWLSGPLSRDEERVYKDLGFDVSFPRLSFHSVLANPGAAELLGLAEATLNEFGLVSSLDQSTRVMEAANGPDSPGWKPQSPIEIALLVE